MSTKLFPGFTSSSLPTGGPAGYGLFKNSSTNYDASWKQGAVQKVAPANYTGVTSGTGIMFGSALAITPLTTGRLYATYILGVTNTVGAGYSQSNLVWGTGSAPARGTAYSTGAFGTFVTVTPPAVSTTVQMVGNGYVLGTVGTAYWFDFYVQVQGGNTVSFVNPQIIVMEF